MASEATILKMRKLLRHPSRLQKASAILWLTGFLLIYFLLHLTEVQQPLEGTSFPSLFADKLARVPLSEISSEMPNLPLAYIENPYDNALYGSRRCGHYPPLWELKFNNLYWQVLHGRQATFYLYSAFYDKRRQTPSPSLRILGMIDKVDTSHFKVFCQIWFEGEREPIISKIIEYSYIWHQSFGNAYDGILQPFLMMCPLPEHYQNQVPLSVSLSETPCNRAYNNIRVTYNVPVEGKRKNIAICVKGTDFTLNDYSPRLVEWLELVSLLGADKVYLNVLGPHPKGYEVLEYYQAKGFVEVITTSLPGDQPGGPSLVHLYNQVRLLNKYQNELIPLNDCFYRNLYRYKLIAMLDTDEMLVPKKFDSWVSLLQHVAPEAFSDEVFNVSTLYFRNIFFLDDMQEDKGWSRNIPHYMHILQHVHRAPEHSGPLDFVKGFHNPEQVLTLHYHLPFACLEEGNCVWLPIDPDDGQLQHYCKECPDFLQDTCENYIENSVLDTTIWKFKDALIENTVHALNKMGYFKDQGKWER